MDSTGAHVIDSDGQNVVSGGARRKQHDGGMAWCTGGERWPERPDRVHPNPPCEYVNTTARLLAEEPNGGLAGGVHGEAVVARPHQRNAPATCKRENYACKGFKRSRGNSPRD